MRPAASFLAELLVVREGKLQLCINDLCLICRYELDDNITYVFTTDRPSYSFNLFSAILFYIFVCATYLVCDLLFLLYM